MRAPLRVGLIAALVGLLPGGPLVAGSAEACTTFCLEIEGGWVVGKNHDWQTEVGMVLVNKRGLQKTSYADVNPAQWTSRYGSVTFNQYGRELPLGGINETGLVIENMWLSGSMYPQPDERPSVAELQWIQYQLDTAGSIEEVIASDQRIRIAPDSSPLHLILADGQGECAAIEFIGGQMVAYRGAEFAHRALANNAYHEARDFLARCGGDESSDEFQEASYSQKRFAWAAARVAAFEEEASGDAVDYAYGILDRVGVDRTQWSIVYDTVNRRLYFRTRGQPTIRYFDMGGFDFTCGTPVETFNMNLAAEGDVTAEFVVYSHAANLRLIQTAFAETHFLRDTPEDMIQWLARYPETMPCAQ